MGNRIGAGFFGDFHEALGDQRAGDGRAEKIEALVNGVRPEHGEDEFADEFLAQILNVNFLDARALGLAPGRLKLFALAEISRKCHDLAIIFHLQPFQDHRGVEPAGIGKHHFFHVSLRGHGSSKFAAPRL